MGSQQKHMWASPPTRSTSTLTGEDQVLYPEGLNGGLEPVLTSLSEALAHNVSMFGRPTHEPTFLPVDLSQVTPGDQVPTVSAPHRTSTQSSLYYLTMGHPSKADSHIGMTAEIQELLSHVVLDTSNQASPALGAPPSANVEDSV